MTTDTVLSALWFLMFMALTLSYGVQIGVRQGRAQSSRLSWGAGRPKFTNRDGADRTEEGDER